MAKFQPILDIWQLDDAQRAKLQPGQWVYAGEPDNRGRFFGQGRTTVVGWLGNARGNRYREYMRYLSLYGRSVRGAETRA